MKTFNAALINEIEKLLKRKKIIIIAILSFLMVLIEQFIVTGVNYGLGLRSVNGMGFPLLTLSVFSNTILLLFITLVAIDVFSGEFSANTIKLSVLRPISRFKLYVAKAVAICSFGAISLFFVMVLSMISGFLFNNFSMDVSSLLSIFAAYAITMIPVMMITFLIMLLTNIIRSGTLVFFICVIIFVSLKGLSIVLPEYANLFVTSMIDWYSLWISKGISYGKIIREVLIILGCSIIFFTGGYYFFDKKEY